MKIIMLGAQGTGKGTQGELLAKALGGKFVSLGDLLREDPEVRAKLADGELLTDAEVDEIALAQLGGEATSSSGAAEDGSVLVFDGYPRRQSQAKTLIRENALPDLVLEIIVPEEEIIQRMLLRGREDDTEAAIHRRLEQYYAERDAVVKVLQEADVKIIQIDGVGNPADIHRRIMTKIPNHHH